MHPAPVRLNRRYSTSSFPSLRVGGSFWHNKAIPDLIFVLPVVQHPVSYHRRACTPPCRYYWPSDCEQAVPQPAKFLENTLAPSWYRRGDTNRYRQRTYLRDLSVYAALIYSVSLNYNELEPRILRGKWCTTFLLRFLRLLYYITPILRYVLSLCRNCTLAVFYDGIVHDWKSNNEI